MGRDYVAITDNADPMHVVVYKRRLGSAGPRVVCRQPVFTKGASATDQSLVATALDNRREQLRLHGAGVDHERRRSTSRGIERVDIDARRARLPRRVDERRRAPSVVPKLSLARGLVYTYTKPKRDDTTDAWYLTALDFDTGEDRLQPSGRQRARLQQQLRAGDARRRTAPPTSACWAG